jgi:hypothetical protein
VAWRGVANRGGQLLPAGAAAAIIFLLFPVACDCGISWTILLIGIRTGGVAGFKFDKIGEAKEGWRD